MGDLRHPMVKLGHGLDLTVVRAQLLMIYRKLYALANWGRQETYNWSGELFTGVTATFTSSNNRGTVGQEEPNQRVLVCTLQLCLTWTLCRYYREICASWQSLLISALGMPEQDYGSHSWYLGAEPVGVFPYLTKHIYSRKQSWSRYCIWESVCLAIQWGGDLYERKQMQPLIGRTGIEFGKTFAAKTGKWQHWLGLIISTIYLAYCDSVQGSGRWYIY